FLTQFGSAEHASATPPVPATSSTEAEAATVDHSPEPAKASPPEDARQLILSVISQKTGYPVEMLDLDMDLETDMGVDSLGRIEIFTAIRDRRPELFADLTTLEKMRTLRDILRFVESGPAMGGGAAATAASLAANLAAATAQFVPVVERRAIHLKQLPSPDRLAGWLSKGSAWLVTDDGRGLAITIAKALVAEGAVVSLLRFPSLIEYAKTPPPLPVIEFRATDENTLRSNLEPVMARDGLAGFVHVHPAGQLPRNARGCFNPRDYELGHAVFFLAKHLSAPLGKWAAGGAAYFAVATRLDGQLGIGRKERFPVIPAGLHGLVKSLRMEWPGVICKAIDLSPALDDKTASLKFLQELANPNHAEVEVGIDAKSRWVSVTVKDDGVSLSRKVPTTQSVFVVSGGARGIVADCLVHAAGEWRCKFIIIGRTGEPPANAMLSEPQKEIQSTLERIRGAGGDAIYLSADVTRRKELAAKLRSAKKFGPVTGLIHAAAVIADKPVERKTEQDFRSVFETKVRGLDNLLYCLPSDSLRHLWLFSSIAGFFGNVGQTDYSMANEVLNKFAGCFIASGKNRTATTINWGPWNGGMMSDTLRDYYRKITGLVEPEQVIRYFHHELSHPNDRNPQLLVNGFGAIPKLPLGKKFSTKVIHRTIDPRANGFLDDYRPGANPVLPDMCLVQWMVEAGALVAEGYTFSAMSRFNLFKRLTFTGKPVACRLECVPNENGTVERPLFDFRVTNADATVCHCTAVLEYALKPEEHQARLSMLPDTNFRVRGESLYTRKYGLFQGPSFRGIEEFVTFDQDRSQARCQLATVTEARQGQFLAGCFNPFVADVFFQPALVWFKQFQMQRGVLTGVEFLQQFRVPRFGESCVIYTFVIARTKNTLTADMLVTDAAGNTIARVSGARFSSQKKGAGPGLPDTPSPGAAAAKPPGDEPVHA
ncbi:MAG TPA: SDR family NAD(P)-dependent oxidoreductase, partial [Verrucomicrobiae bacterium]|nr:SDR family NAD(P)-dependent oxidoreductase [Verrucomicrobiae bacterium]